MFAHWLAVVLVLLPSGAEPVLTSSTPGPDARVPVLPRAITLTFDQPVATHPLTVAVRGPDRIRVDQGDAVAEGNTVRQAIAGSGAAGSYLVAYRVAAPDGHPIVGELRFVVAPGGSSGWHSRTLVVVGVLLAVCLALGLRERRTVGAD